MLSRECQVIIACVIYPQVLKGAQYMTIAKELEAHSNQERQHALSLAGHIDYLEGDADGHAPAAMGEYAITEDIREILR